MPLSASIFRRGGPKKELFEAVDGDADDAAELDAKLADLVELLHSDKNGRELSAALWRPHLYAAELVKQRKQTARDNGFVRGRKHFLHIEEAVYLMDRGDLLLFAEEPVAPQQQQQQQQAQRRLLSMQEAFDFMLSLGVSMERYLLYGSLSRSGYLVMRHPSRWALERDEQPAQVWGSGAWAECYGRAPSVPGCGPQPPMQQQLAAAATAAPASAPAPSLAPVATAGAGPPAPSGDGGRAGDADGAAAMDVDGSQEDGRDAAGPSGTAGAASPAAAAAAAPPRADGSPHAAAAAAAGGAGAPCATQPGGTAAAAAVGGGGGCRGWWPADRSHPHLAGVPAAYYDSLPPATVQERLVHSLQASCPNLRPFPTIRTALAATPPPPPPGPGGAATAATASSATSNSAAAAAATLAALGTPSAAAHLVYDVYKPGSFVSRNRGIFPAVHTHVALCSAAPPSLAELRAADSAAAAATAGGEGGRAAGVTWAAALNGDVALFSMGEADLLQLL